MSKRGFLTGGLLVLGLGLGLSWLAWNRWMGGTWTNEDVTVELWPGYNAVQHMARLEAQLPPSGRRVLDHVEMRSWEGRLKAGRYRFPAGESVKNSATRLVTGNREAVKVVVRAGRDVGPVAGTATRRIHADSSEVAHMLAQDSMMWRVLPNTYEMWWETDAQALGERLLLEHARWWNEDRVA
ncbi:MAG: hypothetical protein QF427_02305, partial [Flavobacteriales bacterium]|nr:hypothetical protein [Flavobacteriales bacterium]